MLRSSHDACGCSTQTTSTINLKRSTLHPHEGQADRPDTPSDSVNLGSNPGPQTVVPSLRPVAAWFSLRRPDIRQEMIRREPLVLIGSGDPGSLPLEIREKLLAAYAVKHDVVRF